jgi:hypothetical protein
LFLMHDCTLTVASRDSTGAYKFHPAVLDACVHVMVHEAFTLNTDPTIYYLPSNVGRLSITDALLERPFPPVLYAHCILQCWRPGQLQCA